MASVAEPQGGRLPQPNGRLRGPRSSPYLRPEHALGGDMSVGNDSREPSGRSTGRRFFFPSIASFAEAKRMARRAAIVGFVFAGMYLIGIFFTLAGYSPLTGTLDPEIA